MPLKIFMHEELCQIKNSLKREWYIQGSGGGRITHDSKAKKIHVHGYCYTFGTADHRNTIELLKQNPAYEGYEFTYEYEKEFSAGADFFKAKAKSAQEKLDQAKEIEDREREEALEKEKA